MMNELIMNITPVAICPACGEDLETLVASEYIHILGKDRHARMCKCKREERDAERKRAEEMEHRINVEQNRARCFSDGTMHDWNFENDNHSVPQMQHAKNYVEKFEDMKKGNIGYLFWGGVGTGKTFMAACIANALIDKEYTVKMTNFASVINDLFASMDKNQYLDSLMRFDLLIIDDLGAERGTEYALENVFHVVDRRYRSGKPLIVTTNLELNELKEESSIEKKRIYDRILEICTPIYVDGDSKRVGVGKEKLKKVRDLQNGRR